MPATSSQAVTRHVVNIAHQQSDKPTYGMLSHELRNNTAAALVDSRDRENTRKERCLDFLDSIENDYHFLDRVIQVTSLGCLSTSQISSARAWNGTLQLLHGLEVFQMHADLIFDIHGIVTKGFYLNAKRSINTLPEVLERLRKRDMPVRLNIKKKLVLHHDNASCQKAISINEFLAITYNLLCTR
ncbi:hypothetical protein J6590_016719 [Homalodisca vitripennis]|nr:hypothetical protein J6590_016719 [Homalodisca vitripennis]